MKWPEGGADARDYRVSFTKIQDRLGYFPDNTVNGAVKQLAKAIRAGDVHGRGGSLPPLPQL